MCTYTQVPTPLSNTPTKLPGRQLRRQLKLSHHTALALLLICAPGAGTAQVVTERDAARAKIAQSLSDRNFDQALAVYDAFVSIGKEPDVELLLPIARAELERETQSSNPTIAAGALERLARAGDADTLASLKRAANTGGATSRAALAPVISMARLGDKEALALLGAWLDQAPPEAKVQMIDVLQEANARAQAPSVAALLDDPAPQVRAAAAVAVGALQYREAIPKLKELVGSDLPTVRMLASAALTRLGDTSAEPAVAALLKSEVPEMRLMAGQALQASKTAQWMPLVKDLRNDRNPINRIRAAEIVACCDPTWSKGILVEALTNDMAIVRLEAARVLEETDLADARLARRMLGDPSEIVRASGAGAVLRLTTKSKTPQRR